MKIKPILPILFLSQLAWANDRVHKIQINDTVTLKVTYLESENQFKVDWPTKATAVLQASTHLKNKYSEKMCANLKEEIKEFKASGTSPSHLDGIFREKGFEQTLDWNFFSITPNDPQLLKQLKQLAQSKNYKVAEEGLVANNFQVFYEAALFDWDDDSISHIIGVEDLNKQLISHFSDQDTKNLNDGKMKFSTKAQDLICDLLAGRLKINFSFVLRFLDKVTVTPTILASELKNIHYDVEKQLDQSNKKKKTVFLDTPTNNLVLSGALLGAAIKNVIKKDIVEYGVEQFIFIHSRFFSENTNQVENLSSEDFELIQDKLSTRKYTPYAIKAYSEFRGEIEEKLE